MKKITKILMLALLFLMAGSVSAQYTFKVDALTKSSTNLYPFVLSEKEWVDLGDPVATLENGAEVIIAPEDTVIYNANFKSMRKSMFYDETTYSGDVVIVTYQGARYYVDAKDLVISDSAGYDFINKDGGYHNFWGRFYSSFFPYVAIFLLLLAATVFALLIRGKNGPRLIPTILVPVFMLLAIALEMVGVVIMGSDMLWWLDSDVTRKVVVIFRLILFAVAVIMQIFSMRLYKNGIVGYMRDPEKKVIVKRPMVGALIGVILLGVSVIVAMFIPKQASLCLTVGAILLVVAILVAIVTTAVVNSKALGKGAGIAFTLFVVIYGIGLITALVLLIMGFVSVFMEMLITLAGCIVVLFFGSKFIPARTYTSGGVTYEVYEDFKLFGKK